MPDDKHAPNPDPDVIAAARTPAVDEDDIDDSQYVSGLPGFLGVIDAGIARIEAVLLAAGVLLMALNTVVNAFGNRVALLATGDPMSALAAIAWAGGNPNGPPPSGRDRITWVGRNAEARDLVVFSVSEAYARVREE